MAPARPEHNVSLSNGRVRVNYTGDSWQAPIMGRGWSPYAIRRIPIGATMELLNVDCTEHPADARSHACLLVAFNAGWNRPLFTWGVEYDSVADRCVRATLPPG